MPYVAMLLFAVGAIVAAYGIAERSRARREALQRLLEAEIAEPSSTPEALADLMTRAGALADRTLHGTSMIHKVQVMLAQAGWSLRPGEFAAVLAVGTVASGLLTWLVTASEALAMAVVIVVPLACVMLLDLKGKRRTRQIEEQLPTVLQLMAGSLESGSSVMHALAIAAEEGDDPIASELSRVVAESRVGRPVVESLEAMARRVGSKDLEWSVEAIRIQHQTGGRLADTLRVVADFMRARVEVRGEVRALSAEARLSAKVLTGLPFLVGGYFFFFRSSYLAPLLDTSMGRWMLMVAGAGIVVGALWMRRIVRVEV